MWAYDFAHIRTWDGRAVRRLLTVIDEYTRECLAIRRGRSIRSPDVIETLAGLMTARGVPEHIRSDNGPEFTAKAVREWLGKVGATTLYIEPGSPWEHGYVESFNGKLRDELLDREVFYTLLEVRVLTGAVPADLQPDQAPQLLGLQAAGVGDHPARKPCPSAGRATIASGTTTEGRSPPHSSLLRDSRHPTNAHPTLPFV